MAYTQANKVSTMQTEGNAVADFETVASTGTSGAAPEGAQYASVLCTVDSIVEPNVIGRDPNNRAGETIFNARQYAAPAGIPIQIPNVIVGVTTITVTDI